MVANHINLNTLLLLAAPARSASGRAGATGSVRHKRVRCNSDIYVKCRCYIYMDETFTLQLARASDI
jgi:hypothetical protein